MIGVFRCAIALCLCLSFLNIPSDADIITSIGYKKCFVSVLKGFVALSAANGSPIPGNLEAIWIFFRYDSALRLQSTLYRSTEGAILSSTHFFYTTEKKLLWQVEDIEDLDELMGRRRQENPQDGESADESYEGTSLAIPLGENADELFIASLGMLPKQQLEEIAKLNGLDVDSGTSKEELAAKLRELFNELMQPPV